MSRFLIIQHQYFGQGSDRGIEITELGSDVATLEDADKQAMIDKGHLSYSGYEVASIVLQIGEKETTRFAPRKLTWKERWTGRIDPTITESIPVEPLKVKPTSKQ
jgi:hypothetical protein